MGTESQFNRNIESLAERAARELLETVPALKTAKSSEKNALLALAIHSGQGSAARLVAAFSRDSSFGDLRDGWIQCGGSGMRVQAHMFPHFLISSIIDGHSAKQLIKDARTFAAVRRSATEFYTPLSGVTVAAAINLENDIDLVPWADVPDGYHQTLFHPDGSTSIPPMRAMPNSVLRSRSAERQVLFSSYKDAKVVMEVSDKEIEIKTVQIQDIVRCMTDISVHPMAATGSWMQFDQKIANSISVTAYSYSEDLFDNTLSLASFNPVQLDGEAVAQLFHRFQRCKSSDRDVLRITLDRLNQALRRPNDVDKAIDLGIALEVMLLHESHKNERGNKNYQGKLKFRSSIRRATFLEGENSERKNTLELLKEAYDLRSEAVHSGGLKRRKKGPAPEQTLSGAIGICARIARKLIERGSFPDWDAEYVIGGE